MPRGRSDGFGPQDASVGFGRRVKPAASENRIGGRRDLISNISNVMLSRIVVPQYRIRGNDINGQNVEGGERGYSELAAVVPSPLHGGATGRGGVNAGRVGVMHKHLRHPKALLFFLQPLPPALHHGGEGRCSAVALCPFLRHCPLPSGQSIGLGSRIEAITVATKRLPYPSTTCRVERGNGFPLARERCMLLAFAYQFTPSPRKRGTIGSAEFRGICASYYNA